MGIFLEEVIEIVGILEVLEGKYLCFGLEEEKGKLDVIVRFRVLFLSFG